MKRLLVLDNYDSFTYNLVHLAKEILGEEVDVYRNDELSIADAALYEKILLSPGPGIPEEAGILIPLIKALAPTHALFGGELANLSKVYHGVATAIHLAEGLLPSSHKNDWFNGMDATLEVGRYHSWVVKQEGFPEDLEITSTDENGMIMSLLHRSFNVQGVQFHPESVLTPQGRTMLENWLLSKP